LPGDYVLTGKFVWLAKHYSPGDVIIFDHPINGLMIKKILSFDPLEKTYKVAGTHPLSADSSTLGEITHNKILGKVIWHIKQNRTNP